MKIRLLLVLLSSILVSVLLAGSVVAQPPSSEPIDVVNYRMAAHNERDLQAFLTVYADDVAIYDFRNTLLGTGKERIQNIFTEEFKDERLHTDVLEQITLGNFVINRESIFERGEQREFVSIYEVKDGLITSVTFLRDK